jgi:hypothetical protein
MLGVVVVGGIYSPQPPHSRWGVAAVDGHTGQSGAPPDTVRCASHVTHPLGFGRCRPLEALSSSGIVQSGVALDMYCSFSDVPLATALLYHALLRTVPLNLQLLQSTVARRSCCSAGAPDSPVAHRTVR